MTTDNVATVLMHIELELIDAHPLNPRLFENAEFIAYLSIRCTNPVLEGDLG